MSDVRSESSSPPALFGFQILGELGKDRLGLIYHARQVLYRREVALRLVADEAHAGMRDLTPACRLAEEISRHGHPQLLKIYEAGESGGQFYLATELPPGSTLRDRLQSKGPMEPAAAVALIASVAGAVAHLHKHHLLHLNLTSSAIYPTAGEVPAVGEAGFAGLLHNRPGAKFPGDPAYAAPEQIAGGKADAHADVYSLGVLLVECLTGHKPQDHPDMKAIPPALAHICKKATDPSPSRRYADAGALADDLEHFVRGDALTPGTMANAKDWVRSNLAVVALSAAMILTLVVATVVSTTFAISASDHARQAAAARAEAMAAHEKADKAAKQINVPKEDPAINKALEAARKEAADHKAAAARQLEVAKEAQKRERKEAERADAEVGKRDLAERNTKLVKAELEAALASRAGMAAEIARVYVAQAGALMDSGDYSGALLASTRALAIVSQDKLPDEAHRLRITALLARLPLPLSIARFPKGDVAFVTLSPDAKHVLVAGADGVAYLVGATSGEMAGKKVVHGAPIVKAAFSTDSKRVLTSDGKGLLRLWSADDGGPVFDPLEMEAPAASLGFSGDGKRFYVVRPTMGDEPGYEVQVRDADKGDPYAGFVNVTGPPLPVGLSYDGKKVAVGSGRSASVYDTTTGKPISPSFDHGAALSSVGLSGDGKFVLTSGGGVARVWNAVTGKEASPKLEQSTSLEPQFDEGGRLVLTVGEDGSARAFDITTGKDAGPAFRAGGVPRLAIVCPDGRTALLCDRDGMAKLFDLKTGRLAASPLAHATVPTHAALSADGTRAMTFDGRVLRVWDMTGGEPLSPAGFAETANVVRSPDGKRQVRIDRELVKLTGDKLDVTLKHKGDVKRAAFSADGALLLTVADPPPGATTPTWDLRVWEAATGKALTEPIEHLREVFSAEFAHGGTHVVTLSLDKKARLFLVKTGEMLGAAVEHTDDLTLAAVDPEAKRWATCDKSGMLRVWDVKTGEAVGEKLAHTSAVNALVFNNEGTALASCCADGSVFVWSVPRTEQLAKLEHGAAVTTATFSPDDKSILTGCSDGTAREYRLTDGKALTPWLRHDAPVGRVAYSEDGQWLLTAAGPYVRLWDAKSGEPLGPPLPHARGEGVVTSLSLSKGGELVTQAGPGTRWSRTLLRDRRETKDLIDLALVLSGREDLGGGQFSAADPEKLTAAWRRILAKFDNEFNPPNSRLVKWAQRGAAECEARGLWGGAARHLDVLLVGSTAATLHARRAKANAEMGRHEAAVADYDKALAALEDRVDLWAGRGASALALGKWDVAANDFTRATKLQDRDAGLLRQLGRAEAERGKWKESAAALTKAVRFAPSVEVACEQAVALLSSGDVKGYQQACAALAKKYGGQQEEAVRRAVADACVLAPNATDYKPLIATAERHKDSAGDQARLAALLLRSGEAAKAVAMLEKLAEANQARPVDLWLLVLACQKAGDKDKAKQAQEKAAEAKVPDGLSWAERQATALLRKEAGGAE